MILTVTPGIHDDSKLARDSEKQTENTKDPCFLFPSPLSPPEPQTTTKRDRAASISLPPPQHTFDIY
jgi:hypothetical protein